MLSVVINGPTFEEASQQIAEALVYADLVELRLDFFKSVNINDLKNLRSTYSIPMIFTLKGEFTLTSLLELKPEYIDLESSVPSHVMEEVLKFPDIKLILSYHNFTDTPNDLEGIYREMQKTPAFFYKIAVLAKNSVDALRLICFAKKSDEKLIAISMGSFGQISRILSPVLRCPITYAALDESKISAPGQLDAKTLIDRYHHHLLNPDTKVYGLIGDPVTKSVSDETHNHLMRACELDAVYVKIQVTKDELPEFLQLAKELAFKGLSVTMPLKEVILPFLDVIDSECFKIGAVNTLLFENNQIYGYNTDGLGALNAIESQYKIENKHLVIIGAGGAAKAIAYEAKLRGARVTIVNRDEKRAKEIAESLHCNALGLDFIPAYDILINCTPAALPIPSDQILPYSVVMDITTKPKETAILKVAKEKGCQVIYGYSMFIEQALGQFALWFKTKVCIQKSRKILESFIVAR